MNEHLMRTLYYLGCPLFYLKKKLIKKNIKKVPNQFTSPMNIQNFETKIMLNVVRIFVCNLSTAIEANSLIFVLFYKCGTIYIIFSSISIGVYFDEHQTQQSTKSDFHRNKIYNSNRKLIIVIVVLHDYLKIHVL